MPKSNLNNLISHRIYAIFFICLIFSTIVNGKINPQDILNEKITKNWSQYSKQQTKDVISKNPIDYHKLGLIFLSNDEHTLSKNYFEKSGTELDLYYRAYSLYKQNNLVNSLALIKEYISLSALNESGLNLYIDILYDMGNYTELQKAIDISKINNITNQNITYKQGLLNLNNKKCSKAIENFETILANNPNATKLNIPLSKAYRMCGDQFKANDLIKKDSNGLLVSNDPLLVKMYEFGNPSYLLKPKIKALLQIKDYNNALLLIKKLTTIQPNDAEVWINYGSILIYLGQNLKKAELAYIKAFELDPKNQLNLRNLISVTTKTNYNESIKWSKVLLELNPNQPDALKILGNYYYANNKHKKALEIYNKLYNQAHENIGILRKIVKILVMQSSFDLAIKKCEVAFNNDNTSTEIAGLLSRVLLITSISNETNSFQVFDAYVQRALRISRNIVRLDNNFNNKFTLLMSLTLNKQTNEASLLNQELTKFSFTNQQQLIAQQLSTLTDYGKTIQSLDYNWIW